MKFKLITCLFLAGMASLNAATVSLSNLGSNPFMSLAIAYNGTDTAASGGIASAGYFMTLSDVDVVALSGDLNNIPTLIADFQVVTFTTLDSAFGGAILGSGLFDLNDTVSLPNATLAGKGLYSFLGNASTLAASDQFLLWDNTDVIDAEDSVTRPDANSLQMATEGIPLIAGANTNVTIDFTNIGGPSDSSVPAIQLAVIPEPSALLLSALGTLFLLRRKR